MLPKGDVTLTARAKVRIFFYKPSQTKPDATIELSKFVRVTVDKTWLVGPKVAWTWHTLPQNVNANYSFFRGHVQTICFFFDLFWHHLFSEKSVCVIEESMENVKIVAIAPKCVAPQCGRTQAHCMK